MRMCPYGFSVRITDRRWNVTSLPHFLENHSRKRENHLWASFSPCNSKSLYYLCSSAVLEGLDSHIRRLVHGESLDRGLALAFDWRGTTRLARATIAIAHSDAPNSW